MSATEELRRLLDERGVEWTAGEDEYDRKTHWESSGLTWEYFNDDNGDAWLGFLGACEQDVSPEQAVEATLGAETCRNVSDPPEGFLCSECRWGDFAEPSHLLTGSFYAGLAKGPRYCPNCGRRVAE